MKKEVNIENRSRQNYSCWRGINGKNK